MSEKRRFWRFIGKNVRKTGRFFAVFGYFVLLWRFIWLLGISPPPPLGQARPGPESPNYGRGMMYRPPSLLLVAWKSYMTSSRTTTSIYIAARFRVKVKISVYRYITTKGNKTWPRYLFLGFRSHTVTPNWDWMTIFLTGVVEEVYLCH